MNEQELEEIDVKRALGNGRWDKQLKKRMVRLSLANNYNDAKHEWLATGNVWYRSLNDNIPDWCAGHHDSCLCGHPIVYHFEIHNTETDHRDCVGSDHINSYLILREIAERTGLSTSDITDEMIEEWIQVRVKTMIKNAWWDNNGPHFEKLFDEVKDFDLRVNVRTVGELYDFNVFMVHSFLRPSEWKLLQHRHIRTFIDDGIEQLVISVPNSKTKNARGSIDSTTTEVAADLYRKKILSRHDGKNDYLFFNDIKDRTYVGDRVSKMFKYLVFTAGLETDTYGQAHTTYSLRHSALCFQILKIGGNDLFGLAKNARTSVLMLEKFYLTHLSPQMPEFTKQLRTKRVLETTSR